MDFDKEMLISHGGAVKSLADDEDEYELCMYKFTSPERPDLTNEYFCDDTDFVETAYPFTSKLLYHHALDIDLSVHPIGYIKSAERRPGDGIYGRFSIDFANPYKSYLKTLNQPDAWKAQQEQLADEYELMLKELARNGRFGGSGGALPQGVIVDDNGKIKRWNQIEYSLTPSPAEPTYTRLSTLKSLSVETFRGLFPTRETAANKTGDSNSNLENEPPKGIKNMDIEQLKQLIQEVLAPFMAALRGGAGDTGVNPDDAMAAVETQAMNDMGKDPEVAKSLTREVVEAKVAEIAQAVVTQHVQKAIEKQNKAQSAMAAAVAAGKSAAEVGRPAAKGYTGNPSNGNSGNARISVSETMKYAGLSAQDMLLGHEIMMSQVPEVLRNRMKSADVLSEDYLRHMVGKTQKSIEKHKFSDYSAELYVKSVMKANEVDTTANTGFGPEWVGQVWSDMIWEKARVQRVWEVLTSKGMRTMEVPEGSSTLNIQTESTDPTVFSYPQSADLDSTGRPTVNVLTTPFATGTVPLTPGALGMASAYSVIEEEDSVIPIAQQLNYQFDEKMQETIEQVIFNGDSTTTASTNINLIDGTPGTGTSRPYYLASNGILKYPLVTNTALKRDASASLSLEDYRKTLGLIAPQFQTRLKNLLWAIDPYVHVASLALPELATDDVRHFNATITSGVIQDLFGIDLVQSGFILKANNAGKIPVAGGTLGRLSLIFAPYWVLGWKRKIRVETGYDVLAQAKVVVATMRMGLVNRGADAAALSYNVGIS